MANRKPLVLGAGGAQELSTSDTLIVPTVTLSTALAITSGGTGANTVAGARTALGITGVSATMQWTSGAIVANGTSWFTYNAPYAGTITSLDWITGNGSFTAAVQIAGTSVTGLSAVVVTTTGGNTVASGANTFAVGQKITVVVTAATSSPTGAVLNLNITKA